MNKLIKNIIKESEEDIDDFFKPKNINSREEKYKKELFQIVNKWGTNIDDVNEENIIEIFSHIEIRANNSNIFAFYFEPYSDDEYSNELNDFKIITKIFFPNYKSLSFHSIYFDFFCLTDNELKNKIIKLASEVFTKFHFKMNLNGRLEEIYSMNGPSYSLGEEYMNSNAKNKFKSEQDFYKSFIKLFSSYSK